MMVTDDGYRVEIVELNGLRRYLVTWHDVLVGPGYYLTTTEVHRALGDAFLRLHEPTEPAA